VAIRIHDSSPTTGGCVITGNNSSSGNRELRCVPAVVDPDGPDDNLFTFGDNDYRLQSVSPCVDTGDPADLPISERDRAGSGRLCDGDGDGTQRVDVGAHEFGRCYANRARSPGQVSRAEPPAPHTSAAMLLRAR